MKISKCTSQDLFIHSFIYSFTHSLESQLLNFYQHTTGTTPIMHRVVLDLAIYLIFILPFYEAYSVWMI